MSPVLDSLYKGIELQIVARIPRVGIIQLLTKISDGMSTLTENAANARM
jgi:hypothetical protein